MALAISAAAGLLIGVLLHRAAKGRDGDGYEGLQGDARSLKQLEASGSAQLTLYTLLLSTPCCSYTLCCRRGVPQLSGECPSLVSAGILCSSQLTGPAQVIAAGRAVESSSPDPLFSDPLAEVLAGKQAIAEALQTRQVGPSAAAQL